MVHSVRSHDYPEFKEKVAEWSRSRHVIDDIGPSANISTESDDTITPLNSETTNGASASSSHGLKGKNAAVGSGRLPVKCMDSFLEQIEEVIQVRQAESSQMNSASLINSTTSLIAAPESTVAPTNERNVRFSVPSWMNLERDIELPITLVKNAQSMDPSPFLNQSSSRSQVKIFSTSRFDEEANPEKQQFSPVVVPETEAFLGTPPLKDEVGISASFIWCNSPDSIFFRTSEQKVKYQELRRLTKEKFINVKPLDKPLVFEVGFACTVYFDFDWWRAEVIDTDAYPEECTVSLLDKGYHRKVRAIDIYPMPQELEAFPRTVLQVSLCGVYPPHGGVWDDQVSK